MAADNLRRALAAAPSAPDPEVDALSLSQLEGAADCALLAEALAGGGYPSLTDLRSPAAPALETLAPALAAHAPGLLHLRLTRADGCALAALAPVLTLGRLQTLEAGGAQIAEIAELPPSLTRVCLPRCGLSSAAAAQLSQLQSETLVELDLSENPGGLGAVLETLQTMPALRALRLAGCGLSAPPVALVAGAPALAELDLSDNAIESLAPLAEPWTSAPAATLRELNVSGNPLGEAGLDCLRYALDRGALSALASVRIARTGVLRVPPELSCQPGLLALEGDDADNADLDLEQLRAEQADLFLGVTTRHRIAGVVRGRRNAGKSGVLEAVAPTGVWRSGGGSGSRLEVVFADFGPDPPAPSLVLLTWDLRRSEAHLVENDVLLPVRELQRTSPGSVVKVVATRMDNPIWLAALRQQEVRATVRGRAMALDRALRALQLELSDVTLAGVVPCSVPRRENVDEVRHSLAECADMDAFRCVRPAAVRYALAVARGFVFAVARSRAPVAEVPFGAWRVRELSLQEARDELPPVVRAYARVAAMAAALAGIVHPATLQDALDLLRAQGHVVLRNGVARFVDYFRFLSPASDSAESLAEAAELGEEFRGGGCRPGAGETERQTLAGGVGGGVVGEMERQTM